MANPVERAALRTRFALGQAGRVAKYIGHRIAVERSVVPSTNNQRYEAAKGEAPNEPVDTAKEDAADDKPKRSRRSRQAQVLGEMRKLFARDLENIEAGYYRLPRGEDGSLMEQVRRTQLLFSDLPDTDRRRKEQAHQEIFDSDMKGKRPRYYLQNFHYQTDGYLSDLSARLYDLQVETLFSGTAGAMRRQCIVPIADYLREHDQRETLMVDVACGTGRLLRDVRRSFPRLKLVGTDLSEPYLREAGRVNASRAPVRFSIANAETLPFADNSIDILSNVYLFHELPGKVRRIVAKEFARVLKPGGMLVFMDSLQREDTPGFEGLLEAFPHGFHEPYYAQYIREDLDAIFEPAGFEALRHDPVFLSKLSVYQKR